MHIDVSHTFSHLNYLLDCLSCTILHDQNFAFDKKGNIPNLSLRRLKWAQAYIDSKQSTQEFYREFITSALTSICDKNHRSVTEV